MHNERLSAGGVWLLLPRLCLLLLLGACAAPFAQFERSQESVRELIADIRDPLSIHVEQEGNDGKRLYVKGHVRADRSTSMTKVTVRLTSLRDGDVLGEAYYPLASGIAPGSSQVLEAGRDFPFSISVAAEGMTDYQLELLWGEDSDTFTASVVPTPPPVPVEPAAVSLLEVSATNDRGSCETQGGCAGKAFVSATLRNSTSSTVDCLVLGLRLEKSGEQESLEITHLGLSPSASRPIRIEVEIPEGGLLRQPELTILQAK